MAGIDRAQTVVLSIEEDLPRLIAEFDGYLATAPVDAFEPMRRLDCRRLYAIPVKGKERDIQICELMWSDSEDTTQLAPARGPAPPAGRCAPPAG